MIEQHLIIRTLRPSSSSKNNNSSHVSDSGTTYTDDDDDDTLNKTVTESSQTNYNVSEQGIKSYFKMFNNQSQKKNLDLIYGVRQMADGGFKIGNSSIHFDKDNIIVGNLIYKATKGLLELLFKKIPAHYMIKPEDESTYGQILNQTQSYKLYFEENGDIKKQDGGVKFSKYIEKHIPKSGGTLPKYMITSNAPIDYIYWYDPNELVV